MNKIDQRLKKLEWDINNDKKNHQISSKSKSFKPYALTTSIAAFTIIGALWLSSSNFEIKELKQQLSELITIEQDMGQYNQKLLTPVAYDIGVIQVDKPDGCAGLTQALDDVVICGVGI